MLASFPVPVLSVTEAIRDIESVDALSGLWTLFTKCKGGLKDGQRLENLSWRLWYREMVDSKSGSRYASLNCISPAREAEPTSSFHTSLPTSPASTTSQPSTNVTTLCPPTSAPSTVDPTTSQFRTATPPIKGDDGNALAAFAYRSPAPSVASVCSPSASTISFSESSNGSSHDSDSASDRSLPQSKVESNQQLINDLQHPTIHNGKPSSTSETRKSHIPSPITSPSPSPCPSSPAPSQTHICDHSSSDTTETSPAREITPHTGAISNDSSDVVEINGDFRRNDAKAFAHNIDISGHHGGLVGRDSGSTGDDSIHRTGSDGHSGVDNDIARSEVAGVNARIGRDAAMFVLQLPGAASGDLMATKNVRKPIAQPRPPSTIGRIICHIILRGPDVEASITTARDSRLTHRLSPVIACRTESMSKSVETRSQRQCPLPTPEHESRGLNLTIANFVAQRDNAYHGEATQNSNPAIMLTISPSTEPVAAISGTPVNSSIPATPNRSPVHSTPSTPQRQSPMSSLPPTPRTSAAIANAKTLGLAPRVVIVNPTPQPTPHPTPPATPTLTSATTPSFVTACGVGLGFTDSEKSMSSASGQLSAPTAILPVSLSPIPTTTVDPTPNDYTNSDQQLCNGKGPAYPCVDGPVSHVRGPLPVPEQRAELPPGKPPFQPKPSTSKPDLSVIVTDKNCTLKPSDRRFFLLQSPEERSPDSATSISASSGAGMSTRHDGSPEKGEVRFEESPESIVPPNRGRETVSEASEEEGRIDGQISSHKKSESVDASVGAKPKERSLSRDSRPSSRAKNRSAGVLNVAKRTASTTSLGGSGVRVRSKGLGLGGGLTMTKGKAAVGKAGLAVRGSTALKRSTSGGIHIPADPIGNGVAQRSPDMAKGKAKLVEEPTVLAGPPAVMPELPTVQDHAARPNPSPLQPNEAMIKHRAAFNIGSGSSEGVESRSGEGSSRGPRSGSVSRGDSVSPCKLGQPSAGLSRLSGTGATRPDALPNNSVRNTASLSHAVKANPMAPAPPQTNNVDKAKAARSPPSQAMARLPNPAVLALNPEAANAALQPSRKRVVVTNTSSEDYETTDLDEDDEDGSWASEDISDEEITFARGANGSVSSSKRAHARSGSVGGRGKGASSSHSRGAASTKNKGKSPAQQAARPALRTKSEAPPPQQQQAYPPAAPALHRRHTSHAIQGQRRMLSKEDEAALKLQAAAVETQRQRELFTKVPVQQRGPGGIQRTRSGLLSQLMNPDPSIFPPNHPYRQSYSAVDLRRMATVPRVVSAGADRLAVLNGANGVAPLPSIADIGNNNTQPDTQRRPTERTALPKAPMVGSFRTSKGMAAVPLAAPVTVTQVPVVNGSGGSGAYRPKGRPQGEELEDDTDTDDNGDNSIQVSKSYAHQKLAELAGRRTAPANGRQLAPQRPPLSRALTTIEAAPVEATIATPPLILAHPYNLPPPPPPSTPRSTRRRMLQTEMSESLRRNLLWERQVSKAHPPPSRRRSLGAGSTAVLPNRPGHLTTTPSMVQLSAKTSGTTAREAEEKERERRREAELAKEEELRRRAIARTRSWAEDYHYTGW